MRLGGVPGEVVQGDDDINQCLAVILMTLPGSVPHEPEFGCGLWEYIDRPVTEVQALLSGAAVRAIRRWEPRVEVMAVSFGYSGDFSGLRVEVRYRVIVSATERVLVLPLVN
jgi:phage baseplate assembly protein W